MVATCRFTLSHYSQRTKKDADFEIYVVPYYDTGVSVSLVSCAWLKNKRWACETSVSLVAIVAATVEGIVPKQGETISVWSQSYTCSWLLQQGGDKVGQLDEVMVPLLEVLTVLPITWLHQSESSLGAERAIGWVWTLQKFPLYVTVNHSLFPFLW